MSGKTQSEARGGIDVVAWNDAMYHKHRTPYGRGIAGAISAARVRKVIRLARSEPQDSVLESVWGAHYAALLKAAP